MVLVSCRACWGEPELKLYACEQEQAARSKRHVHQHYDNLYWYISYQSILNLFEHARMCDKHVDDVSLHRYIHT